MNSQCSEPGEGGPTQQRLPRRERSGAARGSQSGAVGLQPRAATGESGRWAHVHYRRCLRVNERQPTFKGDCLVC